MNRQSDVEERNRPTAPDSQHFSEHVETVIIGGAQAGLSVGYHLKKQGRTFVILDANERIGDSWCKRWDTLRLFTPARYDGLRGWPFPASAWSFPTKDEMADYLEAYAARFDLPVRTGVRVDGLFKVGDRFVLTSDERRFEADHVVVASGACQTPRIPAFARELDPSIVQLHSSEYRGPSQLQEHDAMRCPIRRGPEEPNLEPGTADARERLLARTPDTKSWRAVGSFILATNPSLDGEGR